VDGGLLSKGPAPKDAFAGKVVWITGASQVRHSSRKTREELGWAAADAVNLMPRQAVGIRLHFCSAGSGR
jgi:hypothetical protein